MNLNIGCGKRPIRAEGWVNLDSVAGDGVDVVADLNGPLPFPDDTFDVIYASHVLEHLPNVLGTMEELWRITKPGGVLQAHVPYVGSDAAFEDPTHCRFFAPHSFSFFSQPVYWRSDYGYRGDWKTQHVYFVVADFLYEELGEEYIMERWQRERNLCSELRATMSCVKPARPLGEGPQDEFVCQMQVAHFVVGDTGEPDYPRVEFGTDDGEVDGTSGLDPSAP
jgi:SAM-dependent methyltransferase